MRLRKFTDLDYTEYSLDLYFKVCTPKYWSINEFITLLPTACRFDHKITSIDIENSLIESNQI